MLAEALPGTEAAVVNPLDAIRRLRSAGGALLAQALLHGELARVEWEAEKSRLLRMLAVTLLGFACLLCALLFGGALVLATAWDTVYRLQAGILLFLLYTLATIVAWRRYQALSAQGGQVFANSRDELAKDVTLLKAML